ncbi:MAG: hypothetical protein JSW63_08380 [Ignavibacterium sp.]|nr:MAG: hypothetical protein JSW63_08380 [Ignavibacterium sp.]
MGNDNKSQKFIKLEGTYKMGKGIFLVIIGVSLITSILILKLNANSKEGLQTTVDHYENTQARIIANSGVEVYLEKLRRDKDLHGKFDNINLLDGNYDIDISGPDSFMTITSSGHFGNTNHQTIVTAAREPAVLPTVSGAMYISTDTLNVKLQGDLEIDGNDRNIDDSPGPEAPMPGISVDDPSDSAYVVNSLKPKISKSIEGFGGDPSVHTTVNNTDWEQVTRDLIFAADYTLPTGTYTTGTVLGTFADPKITFVNGDVEFSGTSSGSGIMIINGNVRMSGEFTYSGMLIVYGQSSIETTLVGNGGIYGTTALVGNNVDIKSTGTASFYYSSQAINNAKVNLKSSRFEILSWWE